MADNHFHFNIQEGSFSGGEGGRGSRVVIDKDILGWSDEHKEELLNTYVEILHVGKHSDLPQRSFDGTIANYCKVHDCDLLTGDSTAYKYFFEADIKAVKIIKYDWWKKADKPIYLVQIVR